MLGTKTRRSVWSSTTIPPENNDDSGEPELSKNPSRSTSNDTIDLMLKYMPSLRVFLWCSARSASRNISDPSDRGISYAWGFFFPRDTDDYTIDKELRQQSCLSSHTDSFLTLEGSCKGSKMITMFKQDQGFFFTAGFSPERSLANEVKSFDGRAVEEATPTATTGIIHTTYDKEKCLLRIDCMRKGACVAGFPDTTTHGLQIGDYISKVNGKKVRSLEDINQQITNTDMWLFAIKRRSKAHSMEIKACFAQPTFTDSIIDLADNPFKKELRFELVRAWIDMLNTDNRSKLHKKDMPSCYRSSKCGAYLNQAMRKDTDILAGQYQACRLVQFGAEPILEFGYDSYDVKDNYYIAPNDPFYRTARDVKKYTKEKDRSRISAHRTIDRLRREAFLKTIA
jgi:hypothetical protein